jgi:hypothetical protein
MRDAPNGHFLLRIPQYVERAAQFKRPVPGAALSNVAREEPRAGRKPRAGLGRAPVGERKRAVSV